MKKRYTTLVGEQLYQMGQRLVDERGFASESEMLREAIRRMYSDEFPDYVEVQKKRIEKERESAKIENKIERKEKKKQMEKEREFERKKQICEDLDGEINGSDKKGYTCTFKTYSLLNPNYVQEGEQKVSFEDLTEDLVDDQYEGGTKEQLMEIYEEQDD